MLIGGLLISLTACGPEPALGITRTERGVEVLYQYCADERAKRLQIGRVRFRPEGDVANPVYWEIVSASSALRVDRFTVGSTPDGFRTVVALTRPLPSNTLLLVTLDTTRVNPSISVRLSEIETGKVWYGGKSISIDEYLRSSRC